MLYTTEKEFELFRKYLFMFEDRVPSEYLKIFLTPQPKTEQHALFYSLTNPRVLPVLKSLPVLSVK